MMLLCRLPVCVVKFHFTYAEKWIIFSTGDFLIINSDIFVKTFLNTIVTFRTSDIPPLLVLVAYSNTGSDNILDRARATKYSIAADLVNRWMTIADSTGSLPILIFADIFDCKISSISIPIFYCSTLKKSKSAQHFRFQHARYYCQYVPFTSSTLQRSQFQ